jgi:hypothetical protein
LPLGQRHRNGMNVQRPDQLIPGENARSAECPGSAPPALAVALGGDRGA